LRLLRTWSLGSGLVAGVVESTSLAAFHPERNRIRFRRITYSNIEYQKIY
jgi:hypothetical protein